MIRRSETVTMQATAMMTLGRNSPNWANTQGEVLVLGKGLNEDNVTWEKVGVDLVLTLEGTTGPDSHHHCQLVPGQALPTQADCVRRRWNPFHSLRLMKPRPKGFGHRPWAYNFNGPPRYFRKQSTPALQFFDETLDHENFVERYTPDGALDRVRLGLGVHQLGDFL